MTQYITSTVPCIVLENSYEGNAKLRKFLWFSSHLQ